jgi:iron complex transport system permease protein
MSSERAPSRGVVLAIAGLVWAAGMLLSARLSITSQANAEIEVTSTAYAMPGAVSAMLIAGAAAALLVLALVGRRDRELSTTLRFVIATGTGLIIGALGALSIITINTDGWIYAVVGGTVAAAATIGGALAGFRHPRVVAAICWGSIAVFLVGVVLAFLQDDLLPVFGAADSAASQVSATNYWGYVQGVLSGLVAGIITYLLLRRSARRTGTTLAWPLYALAGAGPGLLLVVGEILTRTAGARVLALAGRVSELDTTIQQTLSGTRLNNGLMVLFVGAFSAIIAVGRTMGSPPDEEPAPAAIRPRRGTGRPAVASASSATSPASTSSPAPASSAAPASSSAPASSPAAFAAPLDPDEIERAAREEEPETVPSGKDD